MSSLPRPGPRSRGAVDIYRLLVATVMLGLLFVTMSWLQGRFDSSDHQKAMEMVKGYRPKGGGTALPEALLRRHPDAKPHDLSWSSEIRSSCLGHVRVYAYVPARGGSPAATYAFDVDLTGPTIHPTDPMTVEILESLETATGTSTSAA